ncbi:MAG TPA: heavy metal sensor histidine kinase [Rhodanobacteraceae bacterium]
MTADTPRHVRSIGFHLALLNIAVVIVAMSLLGVVVMWQMSSTFQAEHKRFFTDKAAELHTDLVEGHGHAGAVLAEIGRETADPDTRQYDARIVTAKGRALGATPGMQVLLPPADFSATRNETGAFQRRDVDRRDYVLTTVTLPNVSGQSAVRVQIALDITRDERLLASLRDAISLTFGILTVLLVLAGYAVSKHSLAPLRRIVGAARAVTPTHLAGRIPTDPPWPRELAELVEVFNAMLARLEEAFGRLSRFSADLAHELRTPLGNISGATEVCLLRDRTAAEYRTTLESNLEECRRLTTLVENLLFMARAEHADKPARVETFAAADACRWVIAQQASAAAAQDHTLEVEGDAPIAADPVLFRQAIANLVANAIAYSGKGCAIRIELATGPADSSVRVVDQGAGIAPEHVPHLFDRFYRADSVRSRGAGVGTGLGLAIVKAIVDLHGGSVDIESTLGKGTSVTLRFPHHVSGKPCNIAASNDSRPASLALGQTHASG